MHDSHALPIPVPGEGIEESAMHAGGAASRARPARARPQRVAYSPSVFAMMFFWISDVPPKIVVTTAARR